MLEKNAAPSPIILIILKQYCLSGAALQIQSQVLYSFVKCFSQYAVMISFRREKYGNGAFYPKFC